MPYDAAVIEEYLNELGLSDAVRSTVLGEFKSNERAATQFVGQRLRHADYTRKAQSLASDRAALEQKTNEQIVKYAQNLQSAEDRIVAIMADFEKESISSATANSRLRAVKEKYNLSDEDIPAVTTSAAARVESTQPAIDIDKKLKEFGNALIADMRREMSHIPDLNAIQYDMARRHRELTGKELTSVEVKELNKTGASHRDGLLGAWKEKYEIDKLEREAEYQSRLKADRQKWDDDLKAQRSNEAMAQATSASKEQPFTATSAVLKRQFERRDGSHGTDSGPVATTASDKPNNALVNPSANDRIKVSGAERAAAKWIERAGSGQLGKPVAA